MSTLGPIIQEAMDYADEQTNPSSGKFSLAWWTRRVNTAQTVLAQETGYYVTRHIVAATANTQISTLPSTLCWGVLSAKLGTSSLTPMTELQMDDEYPGWRYQSNFPNQPQNDNLEVVSSSTSDVYLSLTIRGTHYTSNAYASVKGVALNGTTQVVVGSDYPTNSTTWGEIHYAEITEATQWTKSTAYEVGDVVTQVATNVTRRHRCTVAGTTGTTEPTWATSAGSTCSDGGVTWLYEGLTESVGTITIREASANATITTIAAGDTTSGTDISTGTPLNYIITGNNLEWYPIPDANYTVFMRAGTLPTDFSTASSLTDTAAIVGLPAPFHRALAVGAAALCEISDLYTQETNEKKNVWFQSFWDNVNRLNAYLNSLQKERQDAFGVDASLGWEHYST